MNRRAFFATLLAAPAARAPKPVNVHIETFKPGDILSAQKLQRVIESAVAQALRKR